MSSRVTLRTMIDREDPGHSRHAPARYALLQRHRVARPWETGRPGSGRGSMIFRSGTAYGDRRASPARPGPLTEVPYDKIREESGMIAASEIELRAGADLLLAGASFRIARGDRVG